VTLVLKAEAEMPYLCQNSTKRRGVTHHQRVAAGTVITTAMRPKIIYEYPYIDKRHFPSSYVELTHVLFTSQSV
jgi:hypothetical protein